MSKLILAAVVGFIASPLVVPDDRRVQRVVVDASSGSSIGSSIGSSTGSSIGSSTGLVGQSVAQARADYMARFNYRGHPPRRRLNPPDFTTVGSFEGVGWTSRQRASPRSISTCRPSGRSGSHDDNSRTLVGDATAYGAGGSYRVRIWSRR